MIDVLKLLKAVPLATRLLEAWEGARRGDPAAIAYLREQGWADTLDTLVRPGLGEVTRQAVTQVRDFVINRTIEGQFRTIEDRPWTDFLHWLVRQSWGAFVVVGPKGQGKTMLALRLAEVWSQRHRYPIYGVNLYPEDAERLSDLRRVSIATFARLMTALTRLLQGSDAVTDDEAPAAAEPLPDLASMRRRIVIIDEASLVLHPGGANGGRMTARRAMAQARHLEWLVIYVGQLCQQMPLDLLLADGIFVKEPQGDEVRLDRQEPPVQELWWKAGESFRRLRSSPYYHEYPDGRAWTYAQAAGCTQRGWSGLMPFALPGSPGGPVSEVGETPVIEIRLDDV